MAFTSAMNVGLLCIMHMTVVLHSTSAQDQESGNSCPESRYMALSCFVQTTGPVPIISMTPAANDTTVAAPRTTTLMTTFEATMDINTTTDYQTTEKQMITSARSNDVCCENCTKHCKECFGPGEGNCTTCMDGYKLVSDSEKDPTCEPCSLECRTACRARRNMCECMRGENKCSHCPVVNVTKGMYGRCDPKNIIDILTIPGLIGVIIGGIMFVVLVVIVCCCAWWWKKPPQPVKKNYRQSYPSVQPCPEHPLSHIESHDDEEAIMGQVAEDVYGNVDMQGNMLMFNMPDETKDITSQPVVIHPVKNAPPAQGADYGDVYENTAVGQPEEAEPRRPPPAIPSKPQVQQPEEEQSDFGGTYTNTEIPPSRNLKSPKINPSVDSKMPPLPTKPSSASRIRQVQAPVLPTRPQDLHRDNPAFEGDNHNDLQQARRPFERGESEDMPKYPPPPPPPKKLLEPETPEPQMPSRKPPPTPTKRPSLPTHDQRATKQYLAETDDHLPHASPPAPPVSPRRVAVTPPWDMPQLPRDGKPLPPPTKPPSHKKEKKKPPTPTRRNVDRHIDEENIFGEVEVGASVPTKPATPDFGDTYEVTMNDQWQQPQPDFGMNYEVMEVSPQASPKRDFDLSYNYAGPDGASTEQDDGKDYGGSYEVVEINQDYGGTYEVMEVPPSQPKVDIGKRGPLPLPKNSSLPASSTKGKPSWGDTYDDTDTPTAASLPWGKRLPSPPQRTADFPEEQDFGGEYTNVSGGASGGQNPKPVLRPQPALPLKIPKVKKEEDFYDEALSLDTRTTMEQFQNSEDDSVYQNNQSAGVSRYRNVPAAKTNAPSNKSGGYIKFQKT